MIATGNRHRKKQSGADANRVRTLCSAALVIVASTHAAKAQSQFDKLLSRLPASTNALMVIDVEGIHRSALAVKEGWKDQHETPM